MFNRSLQLTVGTLLMAAAGAAQAQTPAVGLDVIQKYAPTIYTS